MLIVILEYIDDRKQQVLRIIVEDYVDYAEPVASVSVTKKHHLEASPATIRFDMAELEKKGYIKKPHTSAGRIPSDKGYRFFIDKIMDDIELSQREEDLIRERMKKTEKEYFHVMLSELLSALCDNASVVISSDKYRNIYINGISRMLKQPEFSAADTACKIIETLEDHLKISDTLNEYAHEKDEDISIHVGSENSLKNLKQCAIVSMPFGQNGAIGVVGPTRMDYPRVSSILKYISNLFGEMDL